MRHQIKLYAVLLVCACVVGVFSYYSLNKKVDSRRPVVLKVADLHPENYPTMQATLYLAKLVDERSGGHIKMQVYPDGQLGQAKVIADAMDEGIIDIDREGLDSFLKDIPELEAITMPYLFRNSEHVWKVLDGEIGKQIAQIIAQRNKILLCYYDSGARNFYTKKPVNGPEDLKGLNLRVLTGVIFSDTMKTLGASSTTLPLSEVYPALQLGSIDGAENNPPSYLTGKHYEMAKYYVLDEHTVVPEGLFISKKSWDELSPDDQKILKECGEEAGRYQRKLWAEFTEKSLQELKAKGVTVITPDKELFRKAVLPMYEKYPQFKEMISQIQAVK